MNKNMRPERAVVAVIRKEHQFLGIKRSELVRAPGKICFPGGGIEPGESDTDALVRELQEEIGVAITVGEKIWECVTPWGVHVSWYVASLESEAFRIDTKEVAWCRWLDANEFASSPDILTSNAQFFEAIRNREIELPGSVFPR